MLSNDRHTKQLAEEQHKQKKKMKNIYSRNTLNSTQNTNNIYIKLMLMNCIKTHI